MADHDEHLATSPSTTLRSVVGSIACTCTQMLLDADPTSCSSLVTQRCWIACNAATRSQPWITFMMAVLGSSFPSDLPARDLSRDKLWVAHIYDHLPDLLLAVVSSCWVVFVAVHSSRAPGLPPAPVVSRGNYDREAASYSSRDPLWLVPEA